MDVAAELAVTREKEVVQKAGVRKATANQFGDGEVRLLDTGAIESCYRAVGDSITPHLQFFCFKLFK
jgi:hypothetical protein